MPTSKPRRDETLVKALVRAHRWRRKIECGQAKSITDLAEQEGVTDAYVCRVLPLTCLAPEIVEAILVGRQGKGLRLTEMLGNGPLAWEEQRASWGYRPLTDLTDEELYERLLDARAGLNRAIEHEQGMRCGTRLLEGSKPTPPEGW